MGVDLGRLGLVLGRFMLIDEVAQFLEANSIGVYSSNTGRNIFTTNLPDADNVEDNALCIYDTTGLPPNIDIPLSSPSFQILIRDKEADTGSARTKALRDLLGRQYNFTFITNGTYIYSCNLVSNGGHIGKDDKGRDLFSLNFQCKIRDNTN